VPHVGHVRFVAADEVAVLVHGPGQYGEVHLAVVIDGHHPDDRPGRAVTGDQHDPSEDPAWIAGVDQPSPSSSSSFRSATRSMCVHQVCSVI
jgi:hypothetical protein